MVYWEPGTQYNYGDVVNYEGCDYKIIQPHRSQSDWAPPITPALWGRIQHSSGGYGYGNSDCSSGPQQPWQATQQQAQQPPPPPAYPQDNKSQNQGYQPQPQGEGKEHDNDSKKWLIGGGVAAGAAILGAGAFAVHKHNEKKEQEHASSGNQGYQPQPQHHGSGHSGEGKEHESDAKKWLIGGVAGAAAYAVHKHNEHEGEAQSQNQGHKPQQDGEESDAKKWIIGGIAGAAALGAGAYAVHKHNEKKESETQSHNQGHMTQQDGESNAKKWLIGGVAGAAALGAGAYAVHKHNEHKDNALGEQKWLQDAERNTQNFRDNGPTGPAVWVLNRGKTIPPGAIEVGKEHSWTLYICRVFHNGSITPGKASDAFTKGAVIGYGHDEIHFDTYEILLGDMRGLKWVPTSGILNVASLCHRPVDGGFDSDGSVLFVARGYHKGAVHPGKASEKLKGAFIPYGGGEVELSNYEILCYA